MMIHPTDASPDEIAAALAAVACAIEQTAEPPAPPERSAWNSAAALAVQGAPAVRNAAYTRWGQVDRARRAGRWSSGIVGI